MWQRLCVVAVISTALVMVSLVISSAIAADAKALLPRDKALLSAAERGRAADVRSLLLQGANPNCREPKEDRTALMLAAGRGHLEAVMALLDKGVNVRLTDSAGRTALAHACFRGHGEIAKLLVDESTHIFIGESIKAGIDGRVNDLKRLAEAGANPNARTEDGITSLMAASAFGHADAVGFLLEKGADLSAASASGTWRSSRPSIGSSARAAPWPP